MLEPGEGMLLKMCLKTLLDYLSNDVFLDQ